jgi:hypothetical protein
LADFCETPLRLKPAFRATEVTWEVAQKASLEVLSADIGALRNAPRNLTSLGYYPQWILRKLVADKLRIECTAAVWNREQLPKLFIVAAGI